MSVYERHIFVCVHERSEVDPRGCCARRGGPQLADWFKIETSVRGWKGRIRANKAGCLGQCETGPTVVVYPDGTWYRPQTREDVREICDRHIAEGEVVERLLTPELLR